MAFAHHGWTLACGRGRSSGFAIADGHSFRTVGVGRGPVLLVMGLHDLSALGLAPGLAGRTAEIEALPSGDLATQGRQACQSQFDRSWLNLLRPAGPLAATVGTA